MTSADSPPDGHAETPWPPVERLGLSLAQRALEAAHSSAMPLTTTRLLVTTTSRGQSAAALADSGAHVTVYDVEHFRWRLLKERLGERPNLQLVCEPDPPMSPPFDVALLALRRDWAAEYGRDLLQQFAGALQPHGTLAVVVDHADDHWLGDQLRTLASAKSVKRFTSGDGSDPHGATGYLVRRDAMRLRVRDFSCQFAFRDAGRLIQLVSRPGVFSHRRLDLGARRLIDAMRVSDGQRVLDIGCGSGAVALAAALRAPNVHVAAIDSSARAVQCTREGVRLNGLEDVVSVYLSSDGSVPEDQPFDVAVANPPYFANFQIAELFLDAAARHLRPGGQMWIVGKHPEWYQANVPRFFDRVKMHQVGGGYWITTGWRPA